MDAIANLLSRPSLPQRPVRAHSYSLYWSRAGILLVGHDRLGRAIKRTTITLAKARALDARLIDVCASIRFNVRANRWDTGWVGHDAASGAEIVFSGGMGVAFRLGLEQRPEREPLCGFGDPSDLLSEEMPSSVVTVPSDEVSA